MNAKLGSGPSTRRAVVAAIALLALALVAERAAAGGIPDAGGVRGYIVPTSNNPDVEPATTCASSFAANDQSDTQTQSAAGTADNAVTLAGCIYGSPPFQGPSTQNRPAAFRIDSGPGGLLCGAGLTESQTCGLSGINDPASGEYRVLVNNQAGGPTGTTRVTFCGDDDGDGLCTAVDEQGTAYLIKWTSGGTDGGGAGAKCAGKPATIVATSKKTKGTPGNDVILGRQGKDKVSGKGGKDRICGRGGKDKLKGGGGKDNLKGGQGKDRLNGGGGKDKCKGGPGKDKLKSCEKGK